MDENTGQAFSSVVSINPYNDTYVNGVSSFLAHDDSIGFEKEQYSISYINTKDFITAHVLVSKNIPDEDLYDSISNKVYDDLALDQAVTFNIQYIELYNVLDDENRSFNVFILDPLSLQSKFETSTQKIKYIDTIIPVPLLLKTLYTREIITSSTANAFIYFQENSAFITIYDNKEFVFSKTLEHSFVQMHDLFCELYGERIEYVEFIEFFSTQDLKNSSSIYKEFFLKLYKDIFSNINDILTYVKRAYEIKQIDQIFIGTQIHIESKLDEISEFELNIKSSIFEFDYGFESTDTYIDQIHSLMHLYAITPKDQKYNCNFTLFQRPPKFIKRHSGRLILVAAASLILAFIYPVTYWSLSYAQSLQKDILNKEYAELHIKKVTREATIKNRKADKAKTLKLLKEEKDNYKDKKGTLVKIHDVKVNYLMKAKLLSLLTQDLNKYKVGLESLYFNNEKNTDMFTLNLVSYNDLKITNLIKYLTKTHEGKLKFSLEKIYYDQKAKRYLSELKVEVL